MAEPLKHFFNARLVRELAADLERAHGEFDAKGFIRAGTRDLEDHELLGRAAHIAEALRTHLPEDFPAAARVLTKSLRARPAAAEAEGLSSMSPFRYMPHTILVARHGLSHFEESMALQYELTQRFTAEFSIREFLEAHPERTLKRLRIWARDKNMHVRRLVSEGTRPRLPWAKRLREFQRDPSPVLELLELLKDDPERYVQRSVANNLNDIGKDHPGRLVQVCKAWLPGAGEGRAYIVRHALRSLVKQGDGAALKLLGFGGSAKVAVGTVVFEQKRVPVGNTQRFSFELTNRGKAGEPLLIDYAVHFIKANGEASPKVFKLTKVALGKNESVTLKGRIRFQPMTTRKTYPGRHRVDLLVNGVAMPLGAFEVIAAR
jgi:3-methyladenine DNA glycosylase AlkC